MSIDHTDRTATTATGDTIWWAGTAATADTALDQYRHDMALASAPLVKPCTECGRPRALHCTSKSGNRVPFHGPRRVAVALLTDDQKVAAVEEMRREQHAARMAPRLVLTVEQQAVRAATSNAWDAMLAAERETTRGRLPVTDLTAVRAIRRPTGKTVA